MNIRIPTNNEPPRTSLRYARGFSSLQAALDRASRGFLHPLTNVRGIKKGKNNVEIFEAKLSYKIVGILFEVHTKLGGRYQERVYQAAVEKLLKRDNVMYEKELPVDLIFEGSKIGKYFLDFLIERKIVLELKAVYRFHPDHFRQVQSYLKTKGLKLGILANFKGPKLIYSRILN